MDQHEPTRDQVEKPKESRERGPGAAPSRPHATATRDGRVAAGAAATARLVELADLFDFCRACLHETANRFHWHPERGSYAARTAAALPSPDPKVRVARSGTGHRLITGVVQTYMVTAAGHMGALAGLHRTHEVMFSPAMVVRAVIECSSRPMWVLAADTDPERTLARAYLEELRSAGEAKKAASHLGGKTSAQYAVRSKALGDLKTELRARFPGTKREDLGDRPTLLGQRRLELGEGVMWMYDLLEKHAGSTVGGPTSEGIYDFLSSMTHPTLYPTRQMSRWASDPGHPGELVGELHIDLDYLERQASAAVMAFYNAHALVTSYFGWDEAAVHEQLTVAIETVMPTAFISEAS